MFAAQYLIPEDIAGFSVYSPWMTRAGDNLSITLEVLKIQARAQVAVRVFHKDSDETGPGSEASGAAAIGAIVGTHDGAYNGLKEMVRYQFTALTTTPSAAGDYILFRMLSPVWFDSVKAS